MSKNAIVRHLNDHGVPWPLPLQAGAVGAQIPKPANEHGKTPVVVCRDGGGILKNRMYCGDMVQGRYRMKSYKVHVQEIVPQDEWYIVEILMRPSLTGKPLTRRSGSSCGTPAQAPSRRSYTCSEQRFLKCADCGKAMTRSKVGNAVYYYCRTYKDQSKSVCTKHTIKHIQLEAAVLYAIQLQVYLAVDFSKTMSRSIKLPGQEPVKKAAGCHRSEGTGACQDCPL